MQKIRVLLVEMPPVSRDVFKRTMEIVGYQPDMEIVGNFVDPADLVELLLAAGQTEADVVILGLHNAEFPGICSHLLSEYPHIRILGVSAQDQRAVLYKLQPQEILIGEVSESVLLDAIRGEGHN